MAVTSEETIDSLSILCYIYSVLDVNEEQKHKTKEKKLKTDITCQKRHCKAARKSSSPEWVDLLRENEVRRMRVYKYQPVIINGMAYVIVQASSIGGSLGCAFGR